MRRIVDGHKMVDGGRWMVDIESKIQNPKSKIRHPSRRGEKGDGPHLPERPGGCCAQMGTVPFFPARRGVSLMEVLISIGILSVGLLGVAAIIPLGALSLRETAKSDYTGACGRAGIHEAKVRSMLDYRYWAPPISPPAWWSDVTTPTNVPPPPLQPFAIDPLGVTKGLTANLGAIPRINLYTLPLSGIQLTLPQADSTFRWRDDLLFARPEEIKSATPPPAGSRPQAVQDASGNQQYMGTFSWFLTVRPASSEAALAVVQKQQFLVSVVVCSSRSFTNEQTCMTGDPAVPANPPTIAYGGGAVLLTPVAPATTVNVRENTWIMLCDTGGTTAIWYRVVNAGPGGSTQTLCVVGPDWPTGTAATAVIIDTVTGVYTTTVQLN